MATLGLESWRADMTDMPCPAAASNRAIVETYKQLELRPHGMR